MAKDIGTVYINIEVLRTKMLKLISNLTYLVDFNVPKQIKMFSRLFPHYKSLMIVIVYVKY